MSDVKVPNAHFTPMATNRRQTKAKAKSGVPRDSDTYRAARRNIFFNRPANGEGNNTPKFRAALATAHRIIAEESANV